MTLSRRSLIVAAPALILPRDALACVETLGAGGPCHKSGVSYDAASLAIFAAFTTPPDTTRKGVIDTCVRALKTASLWSTLDGLWMIAAADSQAAKINWVNPGTFDATLTDAPTFTTDRGYQTDGSNDKFNLTIAPNTATQFQRNSGAFSVWSRTAGTTVGSSGSYDGATGCTINCRNASDQAIMRVNQAASETFSGVTDGSGLFTATRTAASGAGAVKGFRNGSSLGTGTTASSAVNADVWDLGETNSVFTSRQWAMAAVGSGRNSTQETDFYAAIQTYMTAVGA